MFSLQDLLGQEQGDQALGHISESVGAEPSMVSTAIQAALPMLINGLANNAATPEGAQNLDNALAQDHSGGGILDNLGGLAGMIFGGGGAQPQVNAGGILGHILGSNQGAVAQEVSNQSGLGMGQVAQILMFLGPIVMGYLGRQKQQQGVGADGLGGLLGGMLGGGQAQPASSGILGMASGMLDSNHDGSAVDDIAKMAFGYLTRK